MHPKSEIGLNPTGVKIEIAMPATNLIGTKSAPSRSGSGGHLFIPTHGQPMGNTESQAQKIEPGYNLVKIEKAMPAMNLIGTKYAPSRSGLGGHPFVPTHG